MGRLLVVAITLLFLQACSKEPATTASVPAPTNAAPSDT